MVKHFYLTRKLAVTDFRLHYNNSVLGYLWSLLNPLLIFGTLYLVFSVFMRFGGLERFVDTRLKNFSSGMYARLAFAIAIQIDAPILLVDEVLAVGDVQFQKKCFKVFERFKKEEKTIVLVSHSMDVINRFCDRVYNLERGLIE